MIAMARSGGPVEVRARGPVVRAYCGVDEVVALSLWAALTGRAGTLDTGGTVVEVGELAGLVAEHYGLAPDAVQRHLDPAAPADRYVPDARRWDVLCGEAGLERRALPDLVAATAAWLDGPRS
jgi:nucleoside-diphosphate-sugar epimerase